MVEYVSIGGGRIVAYNADCRDVLRHLAETGQSVDAVCCDPPYHLMSITKRFSKDGGASRTLPVKEHAYRRLSTGFMGKEWDGGDIAFSPETWALHLTAMRPGAYLTAFASSRGFCRIGVAIEDAGFMPHPMLGWIFGGGFPKATRLKAPDTDHLRYGGQTLKPALEPVFMGQVPMEGTGTENWLKHGTGPLDIDAARVEIEDGDDARRVRLNSAGTGDIAQWRTGMRESATGGHALGRWPANIVHDGSPEVLAAFSSRFFYEAKADADEDRWFLCRVCNEVHPARALAAHEHSLTDRKHLVLHPTVKPVELIKWLVRMTTPTRGQVVFDGFAGTGTTGIACLAEGRRAILCEMDPDYFRILVERCRYYVGEREGIVNKEKARRPVQSDTLQTSLFGESAA